MVAVARKHENVYIDTSAYSARRYPPELVRYLSSGSGRTKVLFGTNHPMLSHRQALDGLDGLGLDEETRAAFLGGKRPKAARPDRPGGDRLPLTRQPVRSAAFAAASPGTPWTAPPGNVAALPMNSPRSGVRYGDGDGKGRNSTCRSV